SAPRWPPWCPRIWLPERRLSTRVWPTVGTCPWGSWPHPTRQELVTTAFCRRFSILSCPMADARTTLNVAPRADFGSRNARRMRREGLVPGVVYSGGTEATAFQVAERDVRSVIAEGSALFDLSIDGAKARPVVIKEQQLHPVRGTLRHIDLQEVKLDEAIQADVTIELDG